MFDINEDDLSNEQTRSLLALHLAGMRESSPEKNVFALDLAALQAPGITVWSAWQADRITSIGALRILDDTTAEIKSMRTHPDFLRMGAGAVILDRIIAFALEKNIEHLCLETGSGPHFEAALTMYRRRGFVNGPAYIGYAPNPFSQFLHLDLPLQQ